MIERCVLPIWVSELASFFPVVVRYFVVDDRDFLIGKSKHKRDTEKAIVCSYCVFMGCSVVFSKS